MSLHDKETNVRPIKAPNAYTFLQQQVGEKRWKNRSDPSHSNIFLSKVKTI